MGYALALYPYNYKLIIFFLIIIILQTILYKLNEIEIIYENKKPFKTRLFYISIEIKRS